MRTPSLLLIIPIPTRSARGQSIGFPSTGTPRCRCRHQRPRARVRIPSGGRNQGSPDGVHAETSCMRRALRR
ncbi:hypothetical protein B0H14DRAFT_2756206 [Mycena olivaceomarginata]|nr:hypothetical protein B0H14DRAFT_2756206 [Mycena olivaceomarginata]